MIDREQYLEALELIDNYHRQSEVTELGTFVVKTNIEMWFAQLTKQPSGRLCSILLNSSHFENGKPFEYVEDVNKFDFLRLRNAGKKSWDEFCELRLVTL